MVLKTGVRQFAFILQVANLSPQKQKKCKYRQLPTYAIVTLRNIRREANFALGECEYPYFRPCVHIYMGPSQVEPEWPQHGHTAACVTAQKHSSDFSSRCDFVRERKTERVF